MKTDLPKLPLAITAVYALVWFVAVVLWSSLAEAPDAIMWPVFLVSLPLGGGWIAWARREQVSRLAASLVGTGVFILWWHFLVFASDAVQWEGARATAARWGLAGLFLIGLAWLVWILERASRVYEIRREEELKQNKFRDPRDLIWNPLDTAAWYYGYGGPKLNQSVTGFVVYSAWFTLVCLVIFQMSGCREIYEMPAGGGEQETIAQVVKIQKIIRKKFITNPFSSFIFEERKIDDVQLQLTEITKHAYTVGYGEGAGAGFAGGTQRGKVRFIRLEYSGGDWDQDFGIGGDMNMLFEYGIRTTHKVAEKTESRRIAQLENFPVGKSPPFVFMTGQKNISLSNSEVKTLREYITDKHGMIFCDNGGSRHFHNQFVAMMNRVLPDVRPVPIPLDDVIHRVPFQIPYLPYVAPHGGKEALGWYKDGRWLAYYHPGDIGDAWSDGHAGVDAEVWQGCFQLGTNVIFYAHTEYAKWLQAREQEK